MTPLRVETLTIPPVFESTQTLSGFSAPITVGAGSFQDVLARAQSAAAPSPRPPTPAADNSQPSGSQDEADQSDRQPAGELDAQQTAGKADPVDETERPSSHADSSADRAERTDSKAQGEAGDTAPAEDSEDEEPEPTLAIADTAVAEVQSDPQPKTTDASAPADGPAVPLSGGQETEPETPATLPKSAALDESAAQPRSKAAGNGAADAGVGKEVKAARGAGTAATEESAQVEAAQEVAKSDAKVSETPEESVPVEAPAPRKPGRSRDGLARRVASADSQEPSETGQSPQSATGSSGESTSTQQQVQSELPSVRQVEPPTSPQIAATPPETAGIEKAGMAAGDGDAAAPARVAGDAASQSSAATAHRDMPAGDQLDRVRFVQRVARAFESVGDRGGTLRMRLHPPELGSLRLEVAIRNGVMTAKMEAETPAAQSLLLDNLPMLRERLAEQNIRVERFDVDLMDRSSGGSPGPSDGDTQPRDRHDRHQRPSRAGGEGRLEDVAASRGPARGTTPGRFDVII